MKFFDLNTLDVNRKFKIVIGKRGAGKMKTIYYRGFKIIKHTEEGESLSWYEVEGFSFPFLRKQDAINFLERNYLR